MSEQKLNPDTILDQYKAYLSDLGNFGSRYDTTKGFFLSVVTVLLGVLALAKKDDVFQGSGAYLGLVVSAFAIFVCIAWNHTINSYSTHFKVKFDILREMEQVGTLFPIFKKEEEKLRISARQNEGTATAGAQSTPAESCADNMQEPSAGPVPQRSRNVLESQNHKEKSHKLIRLLNGDRLVPLLLSFPFFFTLILSRYKLLKHR